MSREAFGDEGDVCIPCQENGGECERHPSQDGDMFALLRYANASDESDITDFTPECAGRIYARLTAKGGPSLGEIACYRCKRTGLPMTSAPLREGVTVATCLDCAAPQPPATPTE